MIPRFKPTLGREEMVAALSATGPSVEAFEDEFARTFEARHALAFPYGRSALWALLKALGIEDAEVVLPAYTCVVVAHAIELSGNHCRFVDSTLTDYNMNLDEVASAITVRTRAILATHLFGYPLDCDRLREIVQAAQSKFGHKIYVIHDCAHSFGARWRGRLVCNEGDAAIFGLGISKLMTSIFGGMVTTSEPEIASRLREFRDATFRPVGVAKTAARQLYLGAALAAFSPVAYPAVHWIEHETPLLDRMTKAYHLDGVIHFPPDYLDRMTDAEARVGCVQLRRYPSMVAARVANAHFYEARLRGAIPWELPPIVDGATYSHYVIRVPDRSGVIRSLARQGVELGDLIQYSIPHMPSYGAAPADRYPNSYLLSGHLINLPVHPGLTREERESVAAHVVALASGRAAAA